MNESAKAATSGFIVGAVLGLIGLVFVMKSNEKKDDRKKTSNTITPQTLVEEPVKNVHENGTDRIEVPEFIIPDDIFKESYDTAEELLKDVLYYLLRTGFDNDPEVLLERTIRYCTHFIEDYDWFEKIPSSIESLENSIREFGFEKIYLDTLGIIKEEA
jgi:hypothetical protein